MKIKGPKDKTMLSIVALLLCSIQFVACQSATGDMLGPVTTDMVIDYDDMNTLFSTGEETESPTTEEEGSSTTARSPTTTQLCSTASVTESGSGSNDLLQPENCITEPCLLVPNGTCCQLPDELTPTPSTHSLTEALNQGLCHSLCVEELATSSVIGSATREMLAGYPVWTLVYQSYFFSEDGIAGKDCLLPNNPNGCNLPESCPQIIRQLHDCKQGCMTRLEGVVNKCDKKCVSSCKSQCTDHFISGFGCQVESLPLPCRAVCAKKDCKSGCTQGDNYIDNPNSYSTLSGFGVSSGPTHPPNVTHIVDVRYRVDISNAVPNVGFDLSRVIGYSTVVIMVTNADITRYFVLDDSNEVDLGEFACRTVNISFAVATAKYNVSDFSPSLTIEILNIPDPGAGSCPDQLTENSVNISVEQDNRVGFFQQHIIHVSWSLPNNSQNSNGYNLTLTSFRPTLCGIIGPITIDNTTATNYTFQLSTPDRSDDVAVPPVTQCSYTLRIEVLSNCFRGDDMFSTKVHTGQYTTPTSNNIGLLCNSSISHNITAYDITISVVLDETFTPAVMEAISYFNIIRIEQDSRGLIVPNGNHLFFERMNHINETTIETQYFVTLPPTQPGRQFEFHVTVFWNQDLPRNDIIIGVSSSCVISDIGPIPLHPVNFNDINIDLLNLQAIQPRLYRVNIEYSFTYSYPSDGEFPVDFDVTVSYDESIVSREVINGTLRSGSIRADIRTESDNANFSVILQLRVNTENTESRWSNPLILPLLTESTRPELVTDEQFNVTSFTYSTSPAASGGVKVKVNIEIAQNIKPLTFEVWVGQEELTTDNDPTSQEISLFSSNSTIVNVSNSFRLPSLGRHVYVQIRGINLARITGDWSNPELIHIAEIDPPSSIRIRVNEAQLSKDQMSLSIDMNVSWTPSSSLSRWKRQEIREPEISVTMYIIIVGFEPAEGPYSDPPLGSIIREIQASADLQKTIVDEIDVNMDIITNSTDILTLYIQMRSGSEDVMGRWSEYQTMPVEIPDAVPNPPSNLRGTMHTATSITVTWTETTTTNIDRYEVTYSYTVRRCSAPASPAITSNITSISRSHTLMNLNEDSTYTITVRNINGAASNMSTITANTSTAVPSAGPSSVTPTTVNITSITIEWSELDCTDRNGDITGYRVRHGPNSTTPSQRQISTISGRRFTIDREFITVNYTFEVAAVNVNGTGPYSTPPLTVDTAVPSGLGFYLNGMAYSNNSVVTITDIGEGDMSLYCITSRSECCRSSDGGERGDWFLPGQDSAVKGTSSANFSRRREPRAVVLDRRNNVVVPIGLYRCEIPDASNIIQSLYIGVYTNDRGRPSVSLVSYSHTSQTLNCTSSGGPATNVTWRKDNVIIPLTSSAYQQSQRVADEVTSTYYNFLSITSSNIEDHSGSFSCTVKNNRGSSRNYFKSCPIGSYLAQTSPGSTVCRPCPNNSISILPNSEVCECLQGYHRNPLEDIHVSCTRPPSACRNLRVYQKRTRANTITVRWERPLITGRDDYYYDIFYSDPELPGNFNKHNQNPFIKDYPLVTYSVSGLRPLTNYTIRVVSHNGVSDRVSDQDPEGEEERRCEVSETTGDIRAQPPRSVTSFCSVIVWKAPTRAYGVITGYEVSFSLPGGDNEVVVSKNRDELFHAMKASNLPRGEGDILIKVRAMTVSHNGTWSEAISLDCPGTDNGSACPGF